MRVRNFRRQFPNLWQRSSCAVLLLVLIEVLFFLGTVPAHAATTVRTITAQPADGFEARRLYAGRTVAGRASELGFKHGGELARLHVDIGDRVALGEPLADLNTRSLEARLAEARADVSLAAANLRAQEAETRLARQTEARFRSLRERGHASEQVYDEQRLALAAREAQLAVAAATLERAEASERSALVALEEARIVAPFEGIVQARYFDEGAQVRSGTPVIRLVEAGNQEAHVGIPDTMAGVLTPGETYTVRWSGRPFTAELRALLPEIDAESRTLSAVLRLTDQSLPVGAVVELELEQTVTAAGFWVPLSALTESDRGLWGVFVVGADETVERRMVEVVHAEAERAFVRGTVAPGDRIVSTGVQRLVPGQQVALTPAAVTAAD
jgi:RND family efflux transporter MFP subunit